MPTAMTQNHQPNSRQSAGDALSIAFELVATPALFAFFGWLIDGALGTRPAFTLALCLLTATYAAWKAMRTYNDRMEAYDRNLPSRRAATYGGATTTAETGDAGAADGILVPASSRRAAAEVGDA